MLTEQKTRLTASETAIVWSSYMNNSFAICTLKYFLENVDDPEVKEVLQFALHISEKYFSAAKDILQTNEQTIPVGFTDADVNPAEPRLYSDAFYLYYLKNMSKVGLSVYGVALATAAQSDVRVFLSQAIASSTELYNKTADVLLSKGLFIRPPYVATSGSVDFVDKKSYMGGLLKLNRRPLNVIEITHLKSNVETNVIGRTLFIGLSQAANSPKVREFCMRGKEIAKKHVKLFSSILIEDDLPAPMGWDLEVTDSTVVPFSDKLIMFQSSLLNSSGISNYATAAAASWAGHEE
jgi:hypothetical protein